MPGAGDEMLGFKEDDAMRFIFGEDIMGIQEHAGRAFDRSLLELQVFKEVFCGSTTTHLSQMDLGFMDTHLDLPPQQPQLEEDPNGMEANLDLQVQDSHALQDGALSAELDAAALQGFLGYWQQAGAPDFLSGVVCDDGQHQQQQQSFLGDSVSDAHQQQGTTPQDIVSAGMCSGLTTLGGSSSTSGVDDPMPSYMEALAEISEFQSTTLLSDPFLHQCFNDDHQHQFGFPGTDTCSPYDQGQPVEDTTNFLYASAVDTCNGVVEQYPLFSKSGLGTAMMPQQSQIWFGADPFADLDAICQDGTPDVNISSLDDVDLQGCSSNLHSGSAGAGSKKTLGRDLPDQLEAHAHRLFKDAGWTIKPRKRNDRAKMASYFTAPNREAVHTSLTKAWKFCGKKLCEASTDSERGSYPKEWSDVEEFWKDLTDTMASVDNMLVNQQSEFTLLQRWKILDPFVAVVFISRKITALQQRKTIRVVDSVTFVLDDCTNMPSESKSMYKASDLLAIQVIHSTPIITDSDCSTLATESCNGQQALQSFHDVEDTSDRGRDPKLCRSKILNFDASNQIENHVCEGNDARQGYTRAKVVKRPVKKLRKQSKRIPDTDATGLDGLCSQSFMPPNMEIVFDHQTNVATMNMFNTSEEHDTCSGVGTLKNYLKAEPESEKLDGNNKSNKRAMFLPSERTQLSMLQSESRIEELCHTFSETYCTPREFGATVSCPDDKVQKELPSSHGLFANDPQNSPTDNTVPVELSHKCNVAVLKTGLTRDSQICKAVTAKRKLKGWEKYVKKRPRDLRINDDDLLITAIVKTKDLVSCHKFAADFSDATKFKKPKSQKRVNKLLSRTTGKTGTNLLGGKRISLARKTVICWLIATGFLTVKDVIQYRDSKTNKVVKDGRVTWEGIVCNCCTKNFSVSDFKAHAGCSLPKSSLGLFLQSGKSYTLCQVEAWSAEFMSRRSNACGRKIEGIDENDDTCGFCGDGGELLCCDNCPSTYHQTCLSAKELPEDSWYCHNCICQICGRSISEKEVSTFSDIFKCLQCGDSYHGTCLEQEKVPLEGKRSDTWFCGRYCKEIFIGLHSHVGVDNILDNDLSWSILRCNSDGQKLHSVRRIARLTECNTKLAVALTLLEECFIRMVDPRTGVDMIPHVLYNKGSNFARLDYQGFYSVILEKGDEILCVASIRVHGTKAAELPFLATSGDYRRQGMCRKLMNIIEKMLRSFHVKMLVLSAIPELVNTWVSGFGFKPIEDNERKQLHSINLMLFPGTSLLTKRLDETITTKPGDENDANHVSGLPNGKAGEHLEFHDLDLSRTEFKAEVSVSGTLKHECGSAAWFQSTKNVGSGSNEPDIQAF